MLSKPLLLASAAMLALLPSKTTSIPIAEPIPVPNPTPTYSAPPAVVTVIVEADCQNTTDPNDILYPETVGMPWYAKRNYITLSRIYNHTVYPNQLPLLNQNSTAGLTGLFDPNIVGRVDPVGNFTGFEDSVEYFFALAPVPSMSPTFAAVSSYRLTEFVSACPEVAASTVYLFTSVVNPASPNNGMSLAPLKQVAFWRFNPAGEVLQYDAFIPNLNPFVELTTGAPISNPTLREVTIAAVCQVTQLRCTGPNTQWESFQQCNQTLHTKDYGNYDEAWGDNIVCRTIHLVLTQVRPEVHCPHVGPTGGGKCVDVAYPLQYFNDQALYGEPLGQTFKCPQPQPGTTYNGVAEQ